MIELQEWAARLTEKGQETMARFRNPWLWAYSLISTVVGAVAGAIPVTVLDPEHFNLHAGWEKLVAVMAISGLLALGNFLKQHPLPELIDEKEQV